MEFFIGLFLWSIIFGTIGVAIASNKNVDGLAGFLLGVFLGPIGLIIVALLNPSEVTTSSTSQFGDDGPPCERDLSLDGYRLWLAAKYDIKRNEVFDRFVYDNQTFVDLEAALTAAHSAEQENLAQLAEQSRRDAAAASDWRVIASGKGGFNF